MPAVLTNTGHATCTLLILTYKGKHHLEHLLPTVREVVGQTGGCLIHVLVVDNGRDETTRAWVRQSYPGYGYEFAPANDYLFSLNAFVKSITDDFVFILNDDMKLHPMVLNVALDVMKRDGSLFAVACNVMDWAGGRTVDGVRTFRCKKGWLYVEKLQDDPVYIRYTLYGGGGAAVFRTSVFNALKGFDPLFRPAYCEDLDLGHRAWQNGWRIVYHPGAILYHREGGTIKDQYRADRLEVAISRNRILWMVKNGHCRAFLFWFLIMLPKRLMFGWMLGKNFYLALLRSTGSLPLAFLRRLGRQAPLVNDRELMRIIGQVYRYEA